MDEVLVTVGVLLGSGGLGALGHRFFRGRAAQMADIVSGAADRLAERPEPAQSAVSDELVGKMLDTITEQNRIIMEGRQ